MSSKEAIIKINNLHKVFGRDLHVLQGINLDVQIGEVVVILGPSGSGKSTLLRCINFLEEPTAGTIEVDGVIITAGEPTREHNGHIREIRKKNRHVFSVIQSVSPHDGHREYYRGARHRTGAEQGPVHSLCRRAAGMGGPERQAQ